MPHFGACVERCRMSAETEEAIVTDCIFKECFKIHVVAYIHLLPVIKSRPLEVFVIHPEAQRMDEVQSDFSGAAEPGDISRICGDLRLKEDHVQVGIFQDAMTVFGHVPCHRRNCILTAPPSG